MTEYNVFGDGFENKRLNKHCPVSGWIGLILYGYIG
jgi:hypothetical protein